MNGETGLTTLRELLGGDAEVEAALVESGGEVTPEVEALLARWEGEISRKVDAYCGSLRQLDAQAAALRDEERRLAEYRRRCERASESLRGRLLAALDEAGRDVIETGRNRVRVADSARPRVSWTLTEADLPFEFLKYEVRPDLAKAQDALARGEPLPPGFAVERGRYLRIS